jgi:tetratricopeptide (TPR) repeat protein
MQAVALDSNFAAAYAAMPYMYFVLRAAAPDARQATELQRYAEAAARKAIALDPDLPESWTGLAVALAIGLKDLAGSEAALRKAMTLGGVPRIREHLSRVLMWSGRYAESLEQARLGAEEDPLSPTATADVGEALCANGRYEEGLAQLEKVARVSPPLARVPGYKAMCFLMQQKWATAIASLGELKGWEPWSPLLGYAIAKSGDTARAQAMQQKAMEAWRRTGRGAIDVVYIAEALGDRDTAFEWLERAGNDATNAIMYPLFRDLQADPRFRRHRQRIGLNAGGPPVPSTARK